MPVSSYRISVSDQEKPHAAEIARSIDAGIPLFTKDQGGATIEIRGKILEAVREVLSRASLSDEFMLLELTAEISPEQAATILGVSRPLVYSRMDAGLIPFRQVGTHRRLSLKDVMAHKTESDAVDRALAEMYVEFDDSADPAP